MTESSIHNSYVQKIYQYAKKLIPEDQVCFLKADLFDCQKPSLTYDSFIPDVSFIHDNLIIIGEAKTYDDFKTAHSRQQYEAYFKELASFDGIGFFIVCVPWQLIATANNHFTLLRNKFRCKARIVILSDNSFEVTL